MGGIEQPWLGQMGFERSRRLPGPHFWRCPVYESDIARGKSDTSGATGLIELYFRGIDVPAKRHMFGNKCQPLL
jgi:hypothetical protein